ncbi:MAG: helix-turn-helix domain-containing protein [Candidatus Marinimicrobia bacterium]|nr:helix-turn-helix domain-containing protein [Candidatus Neomarinimicrobiota bacterium]
MGKSNNRYCPHCGSPHERYYSIETAARIMDCSEQFFRNMIRDRKIGYVKVGRMVKIPSSELQKLANFIPSLADEVDEVFGK